MDVKKVSKKTLDNVSISPVQESIKSLALMAHDNIGPIIKEENPDLICLFNVTADSFQKITNMLPNFIAFQVFIGEGNESGIVILCNKSTMEISEDEPPYYFDYPSCSGQIIGTGIIHKKTKFCFNLLAVNVDDFDKYSTILKVVENINNYILIGYNLLEKYDNDPLAHTMNDAWIKLGCPMRVKYNNAESQNRSARIYYHGKHFLPKSISLVGTKIIKSTQAPVSPNYGLITEFTLKSLSHGTKSL